MTAKLKVSKIDNLNTIILQQTGREFFISTKDSFVIDVAGLAQILKFLVFTGMLSSKVLAGILEEYDSYVNDI